MVRLAATIQNFEEQEEDSEAELGQANLRANAHSVKLVLDSDHLERCK